MIILMHKLGRFSRCLFFIQMLSKFVPLCTPLQKEVWQSNAINNLQHNNAGLRPIWC